MLTQEVSFLNNITLLWTYGWKSSPILKGIIFSQLTPSVNSSWTLLFPHMLTTWRVRVCAHLQANWLKSSIMRTLCSVKLYNHWGLHRTWKSRCTCRAFSDEVLINTLAQSFISDCFPATRVVLQNIWDYYIMPWETNLQRSNKEFTKLMWHGFQWGGSGFDKGFFVSRWSSCSKVLSIQRCYQDLKLFALPGRNWLSLIAICLNAVGSSCMAQRARKNPPITAWSTKRDQTLRYGVFYRLFRRMLNFEFADSNFGKTPRCTERYMPSCLRVCLLSLIGSYRLRWTTPANPQQEHILGCSSLRKMLRKCQSLILLLIWYHSCKGECYCYSLISEMISCVLILQSFALDFWDTKYLRQDGLNRQMTQARFLFSQMNMMNRYLHVTKNGTTDRAATNSSPRMRSCEHTLCIPKAGSMEYDPSLPRPPSQTFVHGAGIVLLHVSQLRITSELPSSGDTAQGQGQLSTLIFCSQRAWRAHHVSMSVKLSMPCCNTFLSTTVRRLFMPGKRPSENLRDPSAMATPSWLLGAGGQSGGPPVRRQRVDPPASAVTAENQKKLTILLAKAVLKSCSDIRELQSAVLTTLLIPKDTSVVAAMTAATQEYNSKASDLRKAGKSRECDTLGEPHIHAWAAMVHELSGSGHLTADEKQKLLAHLQSADSVKVLEPLILVAKCRKCFDPKRMRLTLCVQNQIEDILDIVVKGLQGHGAQLKRGVAPRSGNEREIQALLDALAEGA